MAIHKAKVVGRCSIVGVAAGGMVELDDELINVQALVDGEHIEILPEPTKPKPRAKKGDL